MFGETYYFDLIRKYVILVGTMFNDIQIQRTDKSGNVTEQLKIPVTYAPKDKMLARVMQDPAIARPTAVPALPMISFEMGKLRYDGARKLNTVGKIGYKFDANNFKHQYNPVPYDVNFKVYIYVKNAEDGTKIIEQILPYFTPDWTTTLKLIPEVEEEKDIPVVLNDIGYEDNYDASFTTRRAIIWTLDLTVKGYLYGPVNNKPIIKFVDTNFYISTGGYSSSNVGNQVGSIQMYPGLDANNNPTSNATISVNTNIIEASDDYGFITVIHDDQE